MQRVRKLVSAPEDIAGGQEKVTIAVLDTGECVAVLHRGFYGGFQQQTN